MNILFLFNLPIIPYKGGVQRVTSLLSSEFIKRGHKVVFLSLYRIPVSEIDQEKIIALQEYITNIDDKDKSIIEYKTLLQKHQIHFVICQIPLQSTLLLLAHTPSQIRKIIVYHSKPFAKVGFENLLKIDLHNNFLSKYLNKNNKLLTYILRLIYIYHHRKIFNKALELSDSFCLLSSRYYSCLMKYSSVRDKLKLYNIPNPNSFLVKTEINFQQKENVILFVGRLTNCEKNVIDFVHVWNILSKRNLAWKAIIVGDGPDRDLIQKYINENHILRISMIGWVKDIQSYYEQASFLCITSYYEGWPMTILEAMSNACIPCTYSTYEAAYDIIDNNFNGFITTPLNPGEMANKIQSLIDDKVVMNKFMKRCPLKVSQFNIGNIVNKWEDLFHQLS